MKDKLAKLKRFAQLTEQPTITVNEELDRIDGEIDSLKEADAKIIKQVGENLKTLDDSLQSSVFSLEDKIAQVQTIKGDKGDKGDTGERGADGKNGRNPLTVSRIAPSNPQIGDLWYKLN